MIAKDLVKSGMILVADANFTCLDEGQRCEVFKSDRPTSIGELYVECVNGRHYLTEDSIGFSLYEPPTLGALEALQEANKLRNALWDPNKELSLSFFGNELGGEGGEAVAESLDIVMYLLRLAASIGKAQNLVKKVDRERLGLVGSRSSKQALGKELADIVICASLVANAAEIDLPPEVRAKFNETSAKHNFSVTI